MENKPSNAEQALPPEQAAAKAAILAECERLAEAEITFVAVHFDGSGDQGVNEDIKCYATEDYVYEESEVQNANHAEGIFLCEHIFGVAVTNSEGKQVPVRYIGEQHVREDLGRIPTAQDWLSQIKPVRWMYGQRFEQDASGPHVAS
jgi:hypothetical protein